MKIHMEYCTGAFLVYMLSIDPEEMICPFYTNSNSKKEWFNELKGSAIFIFFA
jgi:hypothetical protein